MSGTGYPRVDALAAAVGSGGLRLEPEPASEELRSRWWARVRVTAPDGRSVSVPVEDEYSDTSAGNPALMLHLVLLEVEDWEQAEDLLVWARDAGLDPGVPWVLDVYRELGSVAPVVREMVGRELRPVSSWDMEMNTGPMQALRGLSESAT